jgi:enediyne biosynthesis protein E4
VKRGLIVLCSVLFAASPPGPDFRNIGPRAGLTAIFPNGGSQSKKYIIETTGSGVGFIDYDNDNLLDIFVVSGEGGTNRMYHNEGHDRFRDVTKQLNLVSPISLSPTGEPTGSIATSKVSDSNW